MPADRHGSEREYGSPGGDSPGRPHFRFMGLEIWKEAIAIGRALFRVADRLEARRLYRFAEQLRASGLSMSNNIAERSGSHSDREFHQFLNIARRSTFENANVIVVLELEDLAETEEAARLLRSLDQLCRKITTFQRTLDR